MICEQCGKDFSGPSRSEHRMLCQQCGPGPVPPQEAADAATDAHGVMRASLPLAKLLEAVDDIAARNEKSSMPAIIALLAVAFGAIGVVSNYDELGWGPAGAGVCVLITAGLAGKWLLGREGSPDVRTFAVPLLTSLQDLIGKDRMATLSLATRSVLLAPSHVELGHGEDAQDSVMSREFLRLECGLDSGNALTITTADRLVHPKRWRPSKDIRFPGNVLDEEPSERTTTTVIRIGIDDTRWRVLLPDGASSAAGVTDAPLIVRDAWIASGTPRSTCRIEYHPGDGRGELRSVCETFATAKMPEFRIPPDLYPDPVIALLKQTVSCLAPLRAKD